MRKKPRLNSEFANNKKSLKYYLHVVLWDLPHAHYGQERNFLARLGNDVDLKIILNRFLITSDFLKAFFPAYPVWELGAGPQLPRHGVQRPLGTAFMTRDKFPFLLFPPLKSL